ncbi:MAG: phosphoribosylformylglycinamidine cyclo-ligase [Candidatus Eisenbacteria bacterium]|uniref:Phosphoribosylformylglycinamidine cyclo-ligase n=1 Tax=Eiseniibacteriota bacterium TaxID=2212470 RepID=A0A956N9B4_UNCEI|nr:phosphoribosylformylglycinamidine cyclo-ligase [Candidatus Eisenbacteria bacterium]MCB9462612.1 phosphoribosylformylglycinamidine cyclo-ligase [Candidatus Eisenbacteria bacterium]
MSQSGASYRDAGVDIDEAQTAVRGIQAMVASTRTSRVESELGVFAGFFAYPDAGSERLLVASTDGVGTKLKLTAQLGRWADAGFDIVSHCTSDILVHGARPLFFLDYIGTGKLSAAVVEQLVSGMSEACRATGTAILGGETAEMPGVYGSGDLDLVGTLVGEVKRSDLVDGRSIRPGDVLLGLASIGLHTNGYSLARRIVGSDARPEVLGESPEAGGPTWGDMLLARHRLYFPRVSPLLGQVPIEGMVHITGGGLVDNTPRILPAGCRAHIRVGSWPVLPVFRHLVERGGMDRAEAHRVFNMGIGYVLIVRPEQVAEVQARLAETGEPAFEIGTIETGERGVELS